MSISQTIPAAFTHLVDDAAIFPPGLAPLPQAVAMHADHLRSSYAALVGPFIVDMARLDALSLLAPTGLRVSVVVPAPSDVPSVVAQVAAAGLVLAGLEVKIDGAADQIATIADAAPIGVPTYVEMPRVTSPDWEQALDEVVTHGLRLKLRTGGTEAAAFPTETELAAWITEAVARSVPFKCTAGLHHATRHTGATTGFEHHGYLNVLLATAVADSGGDVAAVVAERDATALAEAVSALSDDTIARARLAFTSYGSCSVLEPLDDLTSLHLIPNKEH